MRYVLNTYIGQCDMYLIHQWVLHSNMTYVPDTYIRQCIILIHHQGDTLQCVTAYMVHIH